jgi:hypothetical protein
MGKVGILQRGFLALSREGGRLSSGFTFDFSEWRVKLNNRNLSANWGARTPNVVNLGKAGSNYTL